MSALGDQFRDAAEWLYRYPFAGCCTSILETNGNVETLVFFAQLFRENKSSREFWWQNPIGQNKLNRIARLIALDLAALIADEDE